MGSKEKQIRKLGRNLLGLLGTERKVWEDALIQNLEKIGLISEGMQAYRFIREWEEEPLKYTHSRGLVLEKTRRESRRYWVRRMKL